MTDRELLEAAARAAGIVAEWDESHKALMIGVPFRGCASMMNYEPWCPLRDDADAFRLAVKLRLEVSWWRAALLVETDDKSASSGIVPLGDDGNAATRRAIVRAAASMAPKGSA